MDVLNLWYLITLLGDLRLWIFLGLALIVFHHLTGDRHKWVRKVVVLVVLCAMVAFGLSHVFKAVFQVPRACIPCPAAACNPYCYDDFAFPSGHTTTAFAAFVPIYMLLGRRKAAVLILALPVLIAVSRVMLGVHSYADVLGGAALGASVALFFWEARRKLHAEG